MEPAGLKLAIEKAITPSRIDVVRAKRLILETLSTGDVVDRRTLQDALASAEGAQSQSDTLIEIVTPEAPADSVSDDHPQIRYLRFRVAAVEATAELAAHGLLVAIDGEFRPSGHFTFKHQTREGSTTRTGTIHAELRLPALATAYRLSHNLLEKPPWFLDVDLFVADLTELPLSEQLRQILSEAFKAYRNGLFLACASLIGAVSEGAWYALAEPISGETGKLRQALDGDRTAHVQKLLADEFRSVSRAGTGPEEVLAHASVLREIRNFGVHPRENPSDDLTGFFSEEACALLILNTHRYLVKLANLAARVTSDSGSSQAST